MATTNEIPLVDVSKVFAASLLERKRLYKFRAIDPDSPGRVKAIFDGELYCPSPQELNDPWECRPRIVMDSITQGERQAFVAQLEGALALEFPEDMKERLAEEVPEDLIRDPKLFLDESYYDSTRLAAYCERIMASLDRQSSTWRICSFSATREHPLLWAHYADAHLGICIEFDASNLSDFGSALPVEYVDEATVLHWFRANMLKNLSSMTTKQNVWSYEQEYRLLAREPYQPWEGVRVDQKIFRFPTSRITGVVLGHRIDEERRQLVRQWLRGHKGFSVTVAQPQEHSFAMTFVDLEVV